MIADAFPALFRTLSVLAFWFSSAAALVGQSAVFGVPSTETQAKGTASISADLSAHLDKFSRGGFQTIGPSTIFGVVKNVEAGANFYYTRNGASYSVELQPHAKWRFIEEIDNGLAASIGTVVFIPLTESAGPHPTAMIYANASTTIKSANDLRLTGGVYQMAGVDDTFGTKSGALLGVEQRVNDKLTPVAD